MTSQWQPANAVEAVLAEAFAAGDEATQYQALLGADLVLPVSPAALAGQEPAGWATARVGGATWLLAFTSPEAMVRASGGQSTAYRTTAFRALAAAWPDPHWLLAVDPGLPIQIVLEPGTVARVAAPPLSVEMALAGHPGRWVLVAVQKALTFTEMLEHVGNGLDRVSGYVHRGEHAAHLDTPAQVVAGLGLPAEDYLDDDGATYLLRWIVVGPALYQSPYGGVDEAGMKAMAGWVVEEPPFRGSGFGRNPDQLIQEYKVDALRLPHGAEVYRLDPTGEEQRIGLYDADLGRWLVVRRVAPAAPSFGPGGVVVFGDHGDDRGHDDRPHVAHDRGPGHRGGYVADDPDPPSHLPFSGGSYDP